MNKQQLAAKIWESANRMRSKIEANEYKDYILGFIFYKYLSDKEEHWLLDRGCKRQDAIAIKLTLYDKKYRKNALFLHRQVKKSMQKKMPQRLFNPTSTT